MSTPFIVAEMSANHLGSLERALKIVEAAADAGADAIKLQTWTRGTMCISDYTLSDGPWSGRRLRDLYEEAFTPWEWHRPIFDRARGLGLEPFSAAFDRDAVDFLETLDIERHKVASFEITDLPLIRHMASKGKPMIISAGMATLDEVVAAVSECQRQGIVPTILRCTSAYPAQAADAHLAPLNGPWGLSDHTVGLGVAVAAAALGACMIEKHLTMSRADGGPDAGFSMEPHEFEQMVTECRRAAAAIGEVRFGPQPGEHPELRRSLWVKRRIQEGEPLRLGDNVVTARPALGLPPSTDLTSQRAARTLIAGSPLTQGDLL